MTIPGDEDLAATGSPPGTPASQEFTLTLPPDGGRFVPPEDGLPHSLPPGPAGPRGYAAAAWLVIILIVVLKIVLGEFAAARAEPTNEDPIGEMLMRIQGRYVVGAARLPGAGPGLVYSQSEQFNIGTVGQRQRFVVLAAELAGPVEARRRLDELASQIDEEEARTEATGGSFELAPGEREVQRVLAKLYPEVDIDEEDQDAGHEADVESLTDPERSLLVEELDWFGELALAPDGAPDETRDAAMAPALKTMGAVLGIFITGGIVAVGGFVGLVVLLIFAFMGKVRGGLRASRSAHGIYAETFALWLGLFMLLQVALAPLAVASTEVQMLGVLVAFFASLVALAWPVLRGVPWGQVRADIGWTAGRRPVAEPLFGVAGYAMALPILAVGVLLTLLFLAIDAMLAGAAPTFAPASGPAHPIVAELGNGNFVLVLLILALGSIAAPIVEETMFRGVLYRHLREASVGLGFVLSVGFASLVNAFVFAVIHPQGWIAIPALMSLAIAFSLAREWRGTVVPAMIMHGVSNGVVLTMITVLASM